VFEESLAWSMTLQSPCLPPLDFPSPPPSTPIHIDTHRHQPLSNYPTLNSSYLCNFKIYGYLLVSLQKQNVLETAKPSTFVKWSAIDQSSCTIMVRYDQLKTIQSRTWPHLLHAS